MADPDKSIVLKTPEEIDIMARANAIVAGVLELMRERLRPGVSTFELDRLAEEYCRDHGAVPSFKGYRGFPASLCVSINDEVVHGIPNRRRKVREGDIVSVDFGAFLEGYHGDAAVTIPVGAVHQEIQRLLDVTRESLDLAVQAVRVGNRIQDVSRAVEEHVRAAGFSVVRQFVGHGIGQALHEGPEVPNYVSGGTSPRIQEGMVIAIEPMVNMGTHEVRILKDRWTVVTADGKPSAHFEHSVVATAQGPKILSARPPG